MRRAVRPYAKANKVTDMMLPVPKRTNEIEAIYRVVLLKKRVPISDENRHTRKGKKTASVSCRSNATRVVGRTPYPFVYCQRLSRRHALARHSTKLLQRDTHTYLHHRRLRILWRVCADARL